MSKFTASVKKFLVSEDGPTAVEYAVMLALIVGSLSSKPWRRHHPALFWPQWAQDIGELRRHWSDMGAQRQRTGQAGRLNAEQIDQTGHTMIGRTLNHKVTRRFGWPLRFGAYAGIACSQRAILQTGPVFAHLGIKSIATRRVHDEVFG
jgi:hypothetical protein